VIWFETEKLGDAKIESPILRAKLTKTLAIIVSDDSEYIKFVEPKEFNLIYQGVGPSTNKHKVEVSIRGRQAWELYHINNMSPKIRPLEKNP
jgi:hypothetical protein